MFSLLRRAVRALQDEIEDVEEVLPRSGELHRLASAQQETTLRLEQVRAPRMTHGSADCSSLTLPLSASIGTACGPFSYAERRECLCRLRGSCSRLWRCSRPKLSRCECIAKCSNQKKAFIVLFLGRSTPSAGGSYE